ncbi:hypothetical protein ABGB79_004345 [Salmonella enterica subsp. enterica]
MTYEELTTQATESITDFMDRAKLAGNRHTAELCFNAAWGAKILWRDLANVMQEQCQELDVKLELWNTINKQNEIFDKLVDVQSVPDLRGS